VKVVRRRFLRLAGAALATTALPRIAGAQAYPARPVRVIVPFAPGGVTDVLARIMAQQLSESMRQQFYVENIAGAGGNIAMGIAAKAPADGHTILVVSSSFVVNPSLYPKIPYDPDQSFSPVTLAAASPIVLVVNPSLPARSVQELIALIKANPGKSNYASPGNGNTGHLAGEMFRLSLNLDLIAVPFNGGAPAIMSTIAGHTPISFTALAVAAPHIKDGTLRALAVTSRKRSQAFPDVPTMAEAGVPDQDVEVMQGIVVPSGTPQEIVARLRTGIARIIMLPDVKERLLALGFEPVGSTPDELAAYIKVELAKWSKIIREASIRPD